MAAKVKIIFKYKRDCKSFLFFKSEMLKSFAILAVVSDLWN